MIIDSRDVAKTETSIVGYLEISAQIQKPAKY